MNTMKSDCDVHMYTQNQNSIDAKYSDGGRKPLKAPDQTSFARDWAGFVQTCVQEVMKP